MFYYSEFIPYIACLPIPGGRAARGLGLWPFNCWDHGSHRRHGRSSFESVVCCVGSSLCHELIARSEECYWVCASKLCVIQKPQQCGGLGPKFGWRNADRGGNGCSVHCFMTLLSAMIINMWQINEYAALLEWYWQGKTLSALTNTYPSATL